MLIISQVLYNPDFCQSFIIWRKVGTFVHGTFPETEIAIPTLGIIVPKPKELQQDPEGDRSKGEMNFYSADPMYMTHTADSISTGVAGTSDQIEWHQHRYRILETTQYIDYGYWEAMAVYMEGD